MSRDEDQDKRIQANTDGLAEVRLQQSLTTVEVKNLRTAFDSGMIDIKDTVKEVNQQLREDVKEERRLTREAADKDREDRRWLWGKIFGIVGSVITLAGAGGGAAWYAMDDKPDKERVEVAAPAPAVQPEGTP